MNEFSQIKYKWHPEHLFQVSQLYINVMTCAVEARTYPGPPWNDSINFVS